MVYALMVVVAVILLIPGIVAVFVPLLPGISYMFLVALLFAAADGFVHLTVTHLGILAGILVASVMIDYLSGIMGAKFGGAHKKSVAYGFVGLLLGIFFIPPLGNIIGLFLGIAIGELLEKRSHNQAVRAATAGVIGAVTGAIINVCLALLFFILFLIFVL